MKNALLLTMILLFMSFTAHAELRLETPGALLTKAQTGRIECREVILDIQQNIPEMRSPEIFDSYFYILDDLSLIAETQGVNEIFPDAVKTLGQQMAANGIRWLSMGRDPIDRIYYYHRWMSADTAFSFESNVELEEKTLQESLAKHFATNIDLLIPFIEKRFPYQSGLQAGYRNLVSDRAAKYLIRQDVTEEDRLFWLSKIYNATGFSTALNGVQNDVLTITKETKGNLHVYFRRLFAIADKINADSSSQAFWLIAQMGDTAVQAVLRAADFHESFNKGEFVALLKLMQAKHLQALAQAWLSVERIPTDDYAEEYLDLTRILVSHLTTKNLSKEASDVSQFASRLAAPVMAKSKRLEGTYELTSQSGKKWIFTAVLAREATLYVALQDEKGFVQKSYFNVSYGVDEDTFVASERDVDTDPEHNMTLKFKLLGNGEIEVRDLMAFDSAEQLLLGKKNEIYPNYFLQSDRETVNPSGTYEGVVYFGKESAIEMRLVVTAFNGYTLGRLNDKKQRFYMDFNIGTRAIDSVLYLTSGRKNTNWVQLRGIVKNGEFRGYVVNGGRGIANREFILKKILD